MHGSNQTIMTLAKRRRRGSATSFTREKTKNDSEDDSGQVSKMDVSEYWTFLSHRHRTNGSLDRVHDTQWQLSSCLNVVVCLVTVCGGVETKTRMRRGDDEAG
jgi:hypothetical protein